MQTPNNQDEGFVEFPLPSLPPHLNSLMQELLKESPKNQQLFIYHFYLKLKPSLAQKLPYPNISELTLKENYLKHLPVEILNEIFGYLDRKDLWHLGICSKWLHSLILERNENQSQLWKPSMVRYLNENHKGLKIEWNIWQQWVEGKLGKTALLPRPLLNKSPTPNISTDNSIIFQHPKTTSLDYLNVQLHKLEKNWNEMSFHIRELKGHEDVIYCLCITNNYLLSGSRDRTIKFWGLQTLEQVDVIKNAHSASILCMVSHKEQFFTGGSDACIKIWDEKSRTLIKELESHDDAVLCLAVDDHCIVSSSKDRSFRIWDRKTFKLQQKVVGHYSAINGIDMKFPYLVTGSGDRIIKVWDVRSGECLRSLEGHRKGVACVHLDLKEGKIYSGSSDLSLRVWDFHTGQLLENPRIHRELIRSITDTKNYIITASYDATICIWDKKKNRLVKRLYDTHHNRILKCLADAQRIYSCGYDQNIYVWDFTGGVDTRFFRQTKIN